MVQWHGVESSNIAQVGYDRETQELRIRFHSGAEYTYANVPGVVFADLVDADSVGKFFNAEIKGKYEYAKVGERREEENV